MEYPVTDQSRGLFVIIKQLKHRLHYVPDNQFDFDWSTRPQLDYNPDEKSILDVFKLKKQTDEHDRSPNLFIGQDLTSIDGGNSFEDFMETVVAYREQNPEFLMFFLMSHGFENGQFLLASQGVEGERGKIKSRGRCCLAEKKQKHKLRDECQARHQHSVIDKMCANFPNIPKIFVFQCCRGSRGDITEKDKADSEYVPLHQSSTELFVSNQPDTFVFSACIEGNASYVRRECGSLLIQEFCNVLEQLKKENQSHEELLIALGDEKADVLTCVEKRREDVIGGWLMNVCQRTANLVTNTTFVEINLSGTKLGRILNPVETYYEIRSPSNDVRAKLFQSFLTLLDKYKRNSRQPDVVKTITAACKDHNKVNGLHILQYLWIHVRSTTKRYQLKLSKMNDEQMADLEQKLDTLIDEITDHRLASKQQPHISSTLSSKLSCIKMMKTKEEADN